MIETVTLTELVEMPTTDTVAAVEVDLSVVEVPGDVLLTVSDPAPEIIEVA